MTYTMRIACDVCSKEEHEWLGNEEWTTEWEKELKERGWLVLGTSIDSEEIHACSQKCFDNWPKAVERRLERGARKREEKKKPKYIILDNNHEMIS